MAVFSRSSTLRCIPGVGTPFLMFTVSWRETARFIYTMVQSSSPPFGTAQTSAILLLLWWLGMSGTDSKRKGRKAAFAGGGCLHMLCQALSAPPVTAGLSSAFHTSCLRLWIFLSHSHCPLVLRGGPCPSARLSSLCGSHFTSACWARRWQPIVLTSRSQGCSRVSDSHGEARVFFVCGCHPDIPTTGPSGPPQKSPGCWSGLEQASMIG